MNIHAIEEEIKTLIIDVLNLEDMTTADIESDAPLFGEGLGLDSIDALEFGIALQKKYQFKIKTNDEAMREHFASVRKLAQFVQLNGKY